MDDFLNYLAQQKTDQTTNKIVFRFAISQDQVDDFEVKDDNYPLSDHQAPAANPKIEYYINALTENNINLEALADQVNLTGTNLQLN